jgi:hypothetical protein
MWHGTEHAGSVPPREACRFGSCPLGPRFALFSRIGIERRRSENAMEELQKTQEYAGERERRRTQQPYEGEDRRKRASVEQPVDNPDSPRLPVSGEDGTGRR